MDGVKIQFLHNTFLRSSTKAEINTERGYWCAIPACNLSRLCICYSGSLKCALPSLVLTEFDPFRSITAIRTTQPAVCCTTWWRKSVHWTLCTLGQFTDKPTRSQSSHSRLAYWTILELVNSLTLGVIIQILRQTFWQVD